MKPKSNKIKNNDTSSKKSILKKKVKRNYSDILLKKALRGKGDFTTWPIHPFSSSSLSSSSFLNKEKKVDIVNTSNQQSKIQNTKRLTELGRVNKSSNEQT